MARGDHIKVRRLGFLYSHHGIDMGDGTVIHFSGEPLQRARARVIRSDFATFCDGAACEVVQYPGPVRSPDEVASVAESLLDQTSYCVLRNNCEHFASYCKTGVMKSRQVRRLILAAGATHALVAVAVIKCVDLAERRFRARFTSH